MVDFGTLLECPRTCLLLSAAIYLLLLPSGNYLLKLELQKEKSSKEGSLEL